MYLDYSEYRSMGGNLEQSAFIPIMRRAERLVNAQAAGQTGKRIQAIINAGEGVPPAVSECIYELVEYLSVNAPSSGERRISSESQSLGGQSESVSYMTVTDEQVKAECDDIIYNTLFGGGCGELLYRGLNYAE